LWLFILRGRRFQFSPQSVQLIVKLSKPGLLDLQLIGVYTKANMGRTLVRPYPLPRTD